MDWVETFQDVNYWAVLGGVVSSFVVGMIWYHESVFGKTWMKLAGLSKKEIEDRDSMKKAMIHSAVATFISASVVAALMIATGTTGAAEGAVFGAIIGFGISMGSAAVHNAFERRDIMLTRIHGLHDTVKFAVIGAILGAWM